MGFTFPIDEVQVFFPYDNIYPEQYRYMCELKKTLDAKGHCVLEMPTGTGKTACLFSLITSYQLAHPEIGKLIYCTRTVGEMNKALEELKYIIDFRCSRLEMDDKAASDKAVSQDVHDQAGGSNSSSSAANQPAGTKAVPGRGRILAMGLSARRNMCIHPEVSQEADRERIDEKCRELTSPWVREKASSNRSIKLCDFYENFEREFGHKSQLLKSGVYTIEDLKEIGLKDGGSWCPYFAARRLIQSADVVVLSYHYVLDPKVSVASQLGGGTIFDHQFQGGNRGDHSVAGENSIIVFDEAHNIDDICVEAMSVKMDRLRLEQSTGNLTKLKNEVDRVRKEDQQRLQDEYQRLVKGLQDAGKLDDIQAAQIASPVLPDDVIQEAVPGNIRRAEHFLSLMKRVTVYLKTYLRVDKAQSEGPLSIMQKMQDEVEVDAKTLRACYIRLRSLLNTLRLPNQQEFSSLMNVANFCTVLGTYAQGFVVICDPYPEAEGMYDPMLHLYCMDSSLAMGPVLKRYSSVILTSGTISPLEMYPRLMGISNVVVTESLAITMDRKCILPLIVTRGPDQVPITSRYSLREDPAVMRNYGELLEDLVRTVPDGLVCFFTSYRYLEQVVERWYETGVIARIMQHKLVFIETKDVVATTYALHLYRQACDVGQGAVFLSVARGKVAEGIDFDRHYGRCVVLFGVPFQYTLSRTLRARLQYLREQYGIAESEFLNFDAMRQASQCVGRVIRSKKDYGIMIYADQRYSRQDKRSKIPEWIRNFIEPGHAALATDAAVSVAKNFLLHMSQPYKQIDGPGASILSSAQLLRMISGEENHDEIRIPADPVKEISTADCKENYGNIMIPADAVKGMTKDIANVSAPKRLRIVGPAASEASRAQIPSKK